MTVRVALKILEVFKEMARIKEARGDDLILTERTVNLLIEEIKEDYRGD